MHSREPRITPVPVTDLRPTQMTVGLREVAEKRKLWREKSSDGEAYLGKHLIPVLLGPKKRPYVLDHHHLTRALMEEGVEEVATTVIADLSMLEKDAFWVFCDNRGWCHPYDAEGQRRTFEDIPKSLKAMKDDPYRRRLRRRAVEGAAFGQVAQGPVPARLVRSVSGQLTGAGPVPRGRRTGPRQDDIPC
jgi:hypothetical protein